MMPQLEEGRIAGLRLPDFTLGLSWFVMGLAKKVLIADRIAPLSDVLFAHPNNAGVAIAWLGSIAYAMQLYFDFSGYSDMALGLARMFSIEFPVNFNSPYKAQGIIELWQRWHMTLSRYLNEYLYTPILRSVNARRLDEGKKVSRKATATLEGFTAMVAFPVMATMFLAGIWHGSGLQFIVFGLLQGVYLTINHAWRIFTPRGHRFHQKLPVPFAVGITFLAFLVSLIFFRAASIHDAVTVLAAMTGLHLHSATFSAFPFLGEILPTSKFLNSVRGTLAALAVCSFIVWALPNTQEILEQLPHGEIRTPSLLPKFAWRPTMIWSLGLTCLLCLSIIMLDASTRFLYFQF
jgi:D-alanyl-lipoteichoic acid acyltransferase DltB (MBOAT superfamily)